MNSKMTLFLFISLIVGIICYVALENIIASIGIFFLYVIISVFAIMPKFKKSELIKSKYHECYHFINNFIISLSIKKSITGAIETTVGSMPIEFVDMFNGLENLSENEKLNYLSTYFDFYDYSLFLQIILIWQEEGGDIIQMSKYLLGNIRHNEEYINKVDTMAKRKYVEVAILWTISLSIIVILRFALSSFYDKIKGQALYLVALLLVFGFVLFTIYLLVHRGTSLSLKGNANHEKNA